MWETGCETCKFEPMNKVMCFTTTQARDSELECIFCCLPVMGCRFRTLVVSFCLSRYRIDTQNRECLLKGYLYPFPMKRRLQFGAYPFQLCDWLLGQRGHPAFSPLVHPIYIVQNTCHTCMHLSINR